MQLLLTMGDIPQLVENILKFGGVVISGSERLLVILQCKRKVSQNNLGVFHWHIKTPPI